MDGYHKSSSTYFHQSFEKKKKESQIYQKNWLEQVLNSIIYSFHHDSSMSFKAWNANEIQDETQEETLLVTRNQRTVFCCFVVVDNVSLMIE